MVSMLSSIEPNPGLAVVTEDLDYLLTKLAPEIDALSGKTVLVTGASGMLASYLVDLLAHASLALAISPIRLLLLSRSYPHPYGRLAHLVGRENVRFLTQDACDPIVIDEAVHYIIHAASPATPQMFRQDPVGTLAVNSKGLQQLLMLAHDHETESFLYISSSEIYGNPEPENIPTPETYIGRFDFMANRACYAEAKRFGETLCMAFMEQYGLPVKIVRPFHIHGPGLQRNDGRIIAEMINRGLDNKPLELASDGSATRTYGYIADATSGFIKILTSNYNGQAFNIGADSPETSILELVQIIANLLGRRDPVILGRTARIQGSPERVRPDLTKARTLLGYSPEVGLKEGLERTIRWFKAQRRTGDGESSD